MRDLLLLAIHLLVTLTKFLGPGGARQVVAESLLLKHQLLISNRSRQRAPNLTMLDRFVLGLATLFVSAAIQSSAVSASPSKSITLLASKSTKMSCVACLPYTFDPSRAPMVRPG
jgi:hypothetical protein